MISLIPEESLTRLKDLFGMKFQSFSKLEVQALVTADIEGVVDNARMRQITGGHAADMTRMLQELVGRGALTQEGLGRWSRYRLPCRPDSIHKDVGSGYKAGDSVHNESGSVHSDAFISEDMDTLRLIAEPARLNRRLSPKEMEHIILKLCHGRWLTRRQLADVLLRNPDGVRSRFLTPMVTHGLLRLRYPDKPNRADQAYIAAEGSEGQV